MVHKHRTFRRYGIILGILFGVALLGLCIGGAVADDPSTAINVTATAYVGVPLVTISAATDITDTTAILHGYLTSLGNANVTCRGFEWGYATGNYTMSWNETGNFTIGAFTHNISTLLPNWTVYWRGFAINEHGQGNSTESSFTTVTLPGAPTNFVVTEVGTTMATITWTMGDRANSTIIRGSSTGYPRTRTDGYLVYSGNGTEAIAEGLNLDTATYYYRAWSQNDYGYSVNYAQDYAGNPIGIPPLIFMVGLCGFAFWKKGWLRIVLSICIIIWGAFAMQYDVKIAAPLLAVGAVLFFMAIMRVIESRKEVEA